MSVKRVFLGWDQPLLHSAAEYLFKRYAKENTFDLSGVALVLPGRRACRRLLEILLEKAEKDDLALLPPVITTSGSLPELCRSSSKEYAGRIQRAACWFEALKACDTDTFALGASGLKDGHSFIVCMDLAMRLDSLHSELAGAGLGFKEALEKGQELPGFVDEERWLALAGIYRCYLNILRSLGLEDVNEARKKALERGEFESSLDIHLVSTSDLNMLSRSILSLPRINAVSLINAPDSSKDMFDEYGCVVSGEWLKAQIPIKEEGISVVDNARDEGRAVCDALSEISGKYSLSGITIGAADEGLVPFIRYTLESEGIPCWEGRPKPLKHTAPVRFLYLLAGYAESQSFSDLASLVRHPDVQIWLQNHFKDQSLCYESSEYIKALDRYHDRHLPLGANVDFSGFGDDGDLIKEIVIALERLAEGISLGSAAVNFWAEITAGCLARLYGFRNLNRNDKAENEIIDACESLKGVLTEMHDLLFAEQVQITFAEALEYVISAASNIEIEGEHSSRGIGILGWLELQLDDADALIITGLNEGAVPTSVSADLFLPDSLRKHLKLVDNERRYARDAFALTSAVHSRSFVKLITARRDEAPLMPSRLLLACRGRELARRVLRMCGSEAEQAAHNAFSFALRAGEGLKVPPPPADLFEPVSVVPVTAFKTYLACPYRFYLRHVLKLEALDDSARELGPRQFGLLAHEIFRLFGMSDLKESTDPEEIESFLHREADRCYKMNFGDNTLPAVKAQIHQLKKRLSSFARWQAEWRTEGWRIKHSEYVISPEEVYLKLPGGQMKLSGRIDRIDFNGRTDTWAVLDYKTGDTPKEPGREHRSRGEWVDLQLPLYLYALKMSKVLDNADLGYIRVAQEMESPHVSLTNWGEDELEEAYELAHTVAGRIKNGVFWPPAEGSLSRYDEFAVICGAGQYSNGILEEDRL